MFVASKKLARRWAQRGGVLEREGGELHLARCLVAERVRPGPQVTLAWGSASQAPAGGAMYRRELVAKGVAFAQSCDRERHVLRSLTGPGGKT